MKSRSTRTSASRTQTTSTWAPAWVDWRYGGGYIGSYAPRNDHGCLVFPDQCDKSIVLKKKPTDYLRDIYVDNIVFTPEMMRHLGAEIGYDRVLVGSDFPYPWETNAVDVVMKAPGATDAQKIAMLGGTAAKLLRIDA